MPNWRGRLEDCNARFQKVERGYVAIETTIASAPEQARMPLRRLPTRPSWKPLYERQSVRIDSWQRFLSEAYWSVTLDE